MNPVKYILQLFRDPCDELAFKGYPDLRYFCLDKSHATFVTRSCRKNEIHCWQIKVVKRATQSTHTHKNKVIKMNEIISDLSDTLLCNSNRWSIYAFYSTTATYFHNTLGTGYIPERPGPSSWSCVWPCSQSGTGSTVWRSTTCLFLAFCYMVPGI